MAILKHAAAEDEILSLHLSNPSNPKAKYTSPDIQNEFLTIIGSQIRSKIVSACNKGDFFSILADEATDTSTKEHLSPLHGNYGQCFKYQGRVHWICAR